MSVEGRAFLKLFRDTVSIRVAAGFDPSAGWNLLPKWTELMVGSADSRVQGDFGLIGNIGRDLGYTVEAEYLRVDQTWSSVPPGARHEWIIEGFIEHENKIANVGETVRKIMHLGPGVKIIVTYPESTGDGQVVAEVSAQIKNHYGTPPDARLVLVLGRLAHQTVQWSGYEFDGLGRSVSLQ